MAKYHRLQQCHDQVIELPKAAFINKQSTHAEYTNKSAGGK